MFQIVQLESGEAEARLSELSDILVDAVAGGASVSFMQPFNHTEALNYWQTIVSAIARGDRMLLAALLEDRAVGTVQLDLAMEPNQPHRANIAKLLVHSAARRRGIGRALMRRVEDLARQQGRTLLTLDTQTGSQAELLYRSLGYILAGVIPNYACSPDGPMKDTSIFYKQLPGL